MSAAEDDIPCSEKSRMKQTTKHAHVQGRSPKDEKQAAPNTEKEQNIKWEVLDKLQFTELPNIELATDTQVSSSKKG